MKRIISILVLLSLTLSVLTGCGVVESIFSTNSSNTRDDSWGYYSVKAVRSYDEVMDALDIVKENHTVKPTYTVKDMGENYFIIYNFIVCGCWTQYPIDYETYFTTKSRGSFSTFIFMKNVNCPIKTENKKCGPSTFFEIYKEDENYEEIKGYLENYGCVAMTYVKENASKIEDRSLLKYSYVFSDDLKYVYGVYYGESQIMDLVSCVPLDESFFVTFFDSLVTTHPDE